MAPDTAPNGDQDRVTDSAAPTATEGAPMDVSPTLELPLLDDRCTHSRCSEAQHGDAYRMVASCMNCSTRVVLLLTSGHEFPGYSSGPKCPACGVRRWSKVGLEDAPNV